MFRIIPAESSVRISGTSSVHPVHAEANGLVGRVEVAASGAGVARDPALGGEVRIAVDRLRSGNPLVDRETRRRIDARRFPEIVGTVRGSRSGREGRVVVSGDLSFRGETRPVEGELLISLGPDGRLSLEGEQTFDVRDWGLQPPRVGLLRVHPLVTVQIRVLAEEVQEPPDEESRAGS